MNGFLKKECPRCGSKVRDLRRHLRRAHGIRARGKKAKIEPQASPSDIFDQLEPKKVDPVMDPDLAELEEKVQATEGVSASVSEPVVSDSVSDEDAAAAEALVILDEEVVGHVVQMLFGVAANMRKSKVWELSNSETKLVAPLATKVANKYLPNWAKQYPDEIVLGVTLVSIVLSKAMLERREMEKKKQEEAAKNPETQVVPNAG